MKALLIIIAILLTIPSNAQNPPAWKWAKSDTAVKAIVGPSYLKNIVGVKGNRVLWGYTQNKKMTYGQNTYGDNLLVEYDTLGVARASTSLIGKISLDEVVADTLGNWYVSGTIYDSIRFANNQLYTINVMTNESMHFLCKLHAGTLALDWYQKIGANYQTTVFGLYAPASTVYLATDSGLSPKIWKVDPATGNRTLFISQDKTNRISSVDEDKLGNIYVAGSCATPFYGVNFNGTLSLPSNQNQYPAYVVRYHANGTHDWHIWMTDNTCLERKVTVAANNVIYYSGALHDSMTFGSFYLLKPKWVYGYMLAKLDSSGNVGWVRTLKDTVGGDLRMEHYQHAVAGADSSITIFPSARGYIDWGQGITTTSTVTTNGVVAHYKVDGSIQWVKQIGSTSSNPQQIAGNGTDVWVAGNGTDSTRFLFSPITTPAAISYPTPYMARLYTGIVIAPPIVNPTGVNSSAGAIQLHIQPNPATNAIIVSGMQQLNAATAITLTDLTGRVVYSSALAAGNNNLEVNVSQLARGMYVLQVRGGGKRYVRKVVLQ